MKKILLPLILCLVITTPAFASKELATKNACMGCHALDSKVLGPAFKEVAKRYAGDKAALSKVSTSIKEGGKGKWGPVVMPPMGQLTDAEVRTLAHWILELK